MVKASDICERMTAMEAEEKYPNSYILMRFDDMVSNIGTILAVCDTEREAFDKFKELNNRHLCGVTEGTNIRRSLGGIVVGG